MADNRYLSALSALTKAARAAGLSVSEFGAVMERLSVSMVQGAEAGRKLHQQMSSNKKVVEKKELVRMVRFRSD